MINVSKQSTETDRFGCIEIVLSEKNKRYFLTLKLFVLISYERIMFIISLVR